MQDYLNKITQGDCVELMRQLPDNSIDLLIADPPYYEIKGEFDFGVWDSFEEYLKWIEVLAVEFKRILKPNGSLFVYGHARRIAYKQVIFDKYFVLENNLVWEKIGCQTMRSEIKQLRCFAPVTERILFYSNFSQGENDWRNNNASVYYEGFEPIRQYLREGIKRVGMKQCMEALNVSQGAIGHYIDRSQFYFPTEEAYNKFKAIGCFTREYEEIRREYEEIRREYEEIRRPFYLTKLITDVIKCSQETHITREYDHPTKKPEGLTSTLITVCSRQNDIVLVPFAGSGVECAMAAKYGRQFIGFELEPKYVDMATSRVKRIQAQTKLF